MDDIVSLVSQYRNLKTERDRLDASMTTLKLELEPLVREHGNWQDKEGYARLTTVQPSESLDTKAALGLMHSWLTSNDPIMQSCGRMLAEFVGEKKGSTYLSVK